MHVIVDLQLSELLEVFPAVHASFLPEIQSGGQL